MWLRLSVRSFRWQLGDKRLSCVDWFGWGSSITPLASACSFFAVWFGFFCCFVFFCGPGAVRVCVCLPDFPVFVPRIVLCSFV